MTTHIDVEHVDSVLLADGWHLAEPNSFDVAPVEYTREGRALLPGDPVTTAGVRAMTEQLSLFDHPHDELAARRRWVVEARLAELDRHRRRRPATTGRNNTMTDNSTLIAEYVAVGRGRLQVAVSSHGIGYLFRVTGKTNSVEISDDEAADLARMILSARART